MCGSKWAHLSCCDTLPSHSRVEAGSPYVVGEIADTFTLFAKIDVVGFACSSIHDPNLFSVYNVRICISWYEAT